MKITYYNISEIFHHYLEGESLPSDRESEINKLIFSCIAVNKKLWTLEDICRMNDLGFERIAKTKMEIDSNNQRRNDIIRELDLLLDRILGNVDGESLTKLYSESPGMLIDRLAILFIRYSFVNQLIAVIKEDELRTEYMEKGKLLSQNMSDLGMFLDSYFNKISNREVYFKIYKPLKIYNDNRIKAHIQQLFHSHNKE